MNLRVAPTSCMERMMKRLEYMLSLDRLVDDEHRDDHEQDAEAGHDIPGGAESGGDRTDQLFIHFGEIDLRVGLQLRGTPMVSAFTISACR